MPRGFPPSAAGGQTAAMSDEWRNMEDFAEGIDTNRLPRTEALAGRSITVELADGGTLTIDFDLDRKSTRLNSSHVEISYAVFCLKKKN